MLTLRRDHQRRHECRYQCDKCLTKFGAKGDLDRHQRTIHGSDKPFLCQEDGCRRSDRPFSRKDNLLKHLRQVHGNIGEPETPSRSPETVVSQESNTPDRKRKREQIDPNADAGDLAERLRESESQRRKLEDEKKTLQQELEGHNVCKLKLEDENKELRLGLEISKLLVEAAEKAQQNLRHIVEKSMERV
jgi:uncharacterized Zn-finger protein